MTHMTQRNRYTLTLKHATTGDHMMSFQHDSLNHMLTVRDQLRQQHSLKRFTCWITGHDLIMTGW